MLNYTKIIHGMTQNLIMFGMFQMQAQICKSCQKGFSMTFNQKGVCIRSVKDQGIRVTDYLSDGLCVLNLKVTKPKEQEQANLDGNTDLLQVFHERLVHQNKRHVKEILKRMNIIVIDANKSFCDGCALGKMHRLFFRIRPSQSENVGELIHADVRGPMLTTSLGKSKYFVCFKDDFSKFRRIFFLTAKSELCRVLEQFLNETKANGHIVKRFRCNGVL